MRVAALERIEKAAVPHIEQDLRQQLQQHHRDEEYRLVLATDAFFARQNCDADCQKRVNKRSRPGIIAI